MSGGVDLTPLPSVDIEGVEPCPGDRRRPAGSSDMNADPTGRRVIRPNVPISAESLGELGGERIVAGDRARLIVYQCAAEIGDHFEIRTRYARPSPSSTRRHWRRP